MQPATDLLWFHNFPSDEPPPTWRQWLLVVVIVTALLLTWGSIEPGGCARPGENATGSQQVCDD